MKIGGVPGKLILSQQIGLWEILFANRKSVFPGRQVILGKTYFYTLACLLQPPLSLIDFHGQRDTVIPFDADRPGSKAELSSWKS